MAGVRATVVVSHFDKNGDVYARYEKQFDSFVTNFLKLLANSVTGSATFSVVDTGGTSRSVSPGGILNVAAPASTVSYGIVAGMGSTPVVESDYGLETPIENGDLANQLIYGATSPGEVEVVGDQIKLHVGRSFINLGTAAVTIREVGMICNSGGYNVLLSRDVIADQVVPTDDGVVFDLIFQTTV